MSYEIVDLDARSDAAPSRRRPRPSLLAALAAGFYVVAAGFAVVAPFFALYTENFGREGPTDISRLTFDGWGRVTATPATAVHADLGSGVNVGVGPVIFAGILLVAAALSLIRPLGRLPIWLAGVGAGGLVGCVVLVSSFLASIVTGSASPGILIWLLMVATLCALSGAALLGVVQWRVRHRSRTRAASSLASLEPGTEALPPHR